MPETSPVKLTALHDTHVDLGAKMVDFAGWRMPVRYTTEKEEHGAVRQAAGLFDVSHMGEFRVRGDGSRPGAAMDYLQRLTPNNVAKLSIGQAHYSALLTEDATYVDDLLIYRLGEDDFMVVVNASNIEGDFAHMDAIPHDGCVLENHSDGYALLALQGPKAAEIMARHTEADLEGLRYYHFLPDQEVCGVKCLLSRTGYTGEEGFELYLAPDDAPAVWRRLLESGADDGLKPCGLAARDTLRLEAGMALYGHEIDSSVTPYEACLGWTVKLKKGDFVGRDILALQKAEGVKTKLAGFEVTGKGIAREGYGVLHDGQRVGKVASGTYAPTLEKSIGTVHLPVELTKPGTELEIEMRRRSVSAVVVPMPFYKRD